MKVVALSKLKVLGAGCIDCGCNNPECDKYPMQGWFVDGGCAAIPSGSIVELRCHYCGFRWEQTWFSDRDNPDPEIVRITPVTNHLFSGISNEDAQKLCDVLVEIYEKVK